jgi:hypothetical protein
MMTKIKVLVMKENQLRRERIGVRFDELEGDRIDIPPEIQGKPYSLKITFVITFFFYWFLTNK